MYKEGEVLDPSMEEKYEIQLRPSVLSEFIGQSAIKESVSVFIEAAKARAEQLDHVILHGPPGLGKTTLSQIIARELGVNFKSSSGPAIAKVGDLAAILTNIDRHDVLFIDEIHRLPRSVEEILYSAMEDFKIDIMIGDGPAARSIKLDISRFTLIGATTRLGLLSSPLRDRFGIPIKLEFYSIRELQDLILRNAKIIGANITTDAILKIASSARGTPRIAIKLLKRARDFAEVQNNSNITEEVVKNAFKSIGVNDIGLDKLDIGYITYIYQNHNGGPVGLDTISAGISESKDTVEDVIEPYLIKLGFINRTPKGRELTKTCMEYVNSSTFTNNFF